MKYVLIVDVPEANHLIDLELLEAALEKARQSLNVGNMPIGVGNNATCTEEWPAFSFRWFTRPSWWLP